MTLVPELDLRTLSRNYDKCLTQVTLYPDWNTKNAFVWIQAGETSLRQKRDGDPTSGHSLNCYVKDGATDGEHDSAYLFQLPLVGLTFVSMWYHQVRFGAYIDPTLDVRDAPRDSFDRFSVPSADYDPFKHKDASRCKSCKGEDSHWFVPYLPPNNTKLYQRIRGLKVEILISPVTEDTR